MKTRVLILVKTYPVLSKTYQELVCTAGMREDGSWIRLYPVPYRKLKQDQQYKKYQWIEIDIVKNDDDPRLESFRPVKLPVEMKLLETIEADGESWKARRELVLKKVYNNLSKLITEAKDPKIVTSLAVFKPQRIIDFIIENEVAQWNQSTLDALKQENMFESNDEYAIVEKIPYKFSYRFIDDEDRESTLMIEDWEIGELYRNCLKRNDGNEQKACEDVRKKYFDDFVLTKDVYLFLGTTKAFHFRSPNPFIIIGFFYPKFESQFDLF
jgi:hypothetical protein